MDKKTACRPRLVLVCQECELMAEWLCRYLFFQKISGTDADEIIVKNGNCILALHPLTTDLMENSKENRICGLEHLALETGDIHAAGMWCAKHGLEMDTDPTAPFFNPGVFGKGEYYFHVKTPSGMWLEISQKAASEGVSEKNPVIFGLDHLGIPCEDFRKEVEFLETAGFQNLFRPVENKNEQDGRILCVMMSDGELVLEVYEFLDQKKKKRGMNNGIFSDEFLFVRTVL